MKAKKFEYISKWLGKGLSIKDSSLEQLPILLDEFLYRIRLDISKEQLSYSDKDAEDMTNSVDGNLGLDPWWDENKDLKEVDSLNQSHL